MVLLSVVILITIYPTLEEYHTSTEQPTLLLRKHLCDHAFFAQGTSEACTVEQRLLQCLAWWSLSTTSLVLFGLSAIWRRRRTITREGDCLNPTQGFTLVPLLADDCSSSTPSHHLPRGTVSFGVSIEQSLQARSKTCHK